MYRRVTDELELVWFKPSTRAQQQNAYVLPANGDDYEYSAAWPTDLVSLRYAALQTAFTTALTLLCSDIVCIMIYNLIIII